MISPSASSPPPTSTADADFSPAISRRACAAPAAATAEGRGPLLGVGGRLALPALRPPPRRPEQPTEEAEAAAGEGARVLVAAAASSGEAANPTSGTSSTSSSTSSDFTSSSITSSLAACGDEAAGAGEAAARAALGGGTGGGGIAEAGVQETAARCRNLATCVSKSLSMPAAWQSLRRCPTTSRMKGSWMKSVRIQ